MNELHESPNQPARASVRFWREPWASTQRLICQIVAVAAVIAFQAGRGDLCHAEDVDFNRDIRPLLADKCFKCHGPDENRRDSELRLDLQESAFSDLGGYRAIVPGDRRQSALYQRITSDDADVRMPPTAEPLQLSTAERELLGRWIDEGAKWTGHWAFTPPVRPSPPKLAQTDWPRNPIDHFVLHQLEQAGMAPAPEAVRETLLRRVTLDLTGLPPTIAEIDAFLADTSSTAYERVVDRLLASPRYGEQMARPWLDAARYADTDGYQNDRIRYMWAWRDWVIRALNQNMPFDQFTLEQLAGDMLPDATLHQQVATGFNRNHRINSEGGSIPAEFAVEYVVDRVDTTGTVWLGLTIGCARCHDHKYDPLSQKEYYRLFAFYNNVPEWGLGPNNGNSPPFIKLPESWPDVPDEENHAITPAPYKLNTTQTSVVRPNPGGPETYMVMQEMDSPRKTYLLRRGAYDQPDKSEVLTPDVPASLGSMADELPHNRIGLARWLTSPSNPLTARVTVNRYWQLFFGTGLVKTSENFGVQGEPPSHPRLLDWLATEFISNDWDVKRIHKLMVTSATYRQSSAASPKLVRRDPENRLLARGPRFRLSAYMLRDQALAASGLLVEKLGGPSVKPYMPLGIWKSISNNKYVQDHGEKLYRRSLYTYWRRTVPPPTMLTFNAAEREVCVVRKDRTTTPLQALTLLNNITFVEAARFLAERMLQDGGSLPEDRLRHGYRLATGRHPKPAQLELLGEALEVFRQRYHDDAQAAAALLQVGEKPRDKKLPTVELAAYTMVASAMMNLDECLTRE